MNIIKRIITGGIILLLCGVSYSSSISIDIKSIRFDNNDEEVCRKCNTDIDSELIKIEKLIDRADSYSKLLLILSSFKIELLDVYEELSNDIIILFEMYKETKSNSLIKDFHIICDLLIAMLLHINDTCWNIVEFIFKYENVYPTLTIVLGLMLWILAMTIEPLVFLSVFLECKF